jgi:negative regulator of sigma E activity
MSVARVFTVGLLVSLSLSALGAQAPPAEVWLAAADAARNAFEEAVISARASQVVAEKVTGSADFDIYAKGRDKALIIFRGGKNNGRKILTSGDRMWLIVPGASHPVPITANQRLLGGASMADVARLRFAEDYSATLRPGTETVNGKVCRVLDLTAKSSKTAYPRVVLWMDEMERLPVRVLFSLASGREAKEVSFMKFGRVAGKTVVTEMEIRDLLSSQSGAITRLEYRDYRPAKLDDAIFTPEGSAGL